jgi:2-methylisocitrate lyase-like PEP mutase family enzyme
MGMIIPSRFNIKRCSEIGDIGSAKLLQGLGFKALATTSAGLAYTLGCADGELSLGEVLGHCAQLAVNTDIPINADFENGFADEPEQVAKNVIMMVSTGVAGCSIEDYGSADDRIYDFEHAVDRVQAAAEAVAALDFPFLLTARAENLLHGVLDLEDTIRRLQAFEKVGADVLYAPGISSLDQLRQVTGELNSSFNVLAPFIPDATQRDLAEAGAIRISIGGALNWLAVEPVLVAAKEMMEYGSFNWTKKVVSSQKINDLIS